MKEKKVTFADLAKYTGFSKTTISRYFNDPESVTLKNQELIQKAIDTLGYKENKLARVLANGRTEFIGILVPNLHMHYYAELLSYILTTSEKYGYKFMVFNGDGDKAKERQYMSEMLAYKVEGLIVITHTCTSEELSKLGIPVVTVEREDRYVNSVNSDNYEGGKMAAQHLADCGCDVLIHLNADLKKSTPDYGRIRGFREVVRSTGLESREYLRVYGDRYEVMEPVVNEVFEDIDRNYAGRKKGIFVSNDSLANVLINRIVSAYGKLPDDWFIVGFDDSPIARESIVPMTTIRQNVPEIVDTAMNILIRLMTEQKKRKPVIQKQREHRMIDVELAIRKTTHC